MSSLNIISNIGLKILGLGLVLILLFALLLLIGHHYLALYLPYIVFEPCPISFFDIGAIISVYHSIAENSIGNFKNGIENILRECYNIMW